MLALANLPDLVAALTETIFDHIEELDALDRAIGDGDHGTNLERGARAVLGGWPELAGEPYGAALAGIGRLLAMSVGGASGALYGTLFMAFGRALPTPCDRAGLAAAFGAGVAAVAARGRSAPGEKTMLDVLVPLARLLADPDRRLTAASVAECVGTAAAATIPMRALRGRASFLGERSIGHMDPGARSSMLMAIALCRVPPSG